MSDEKLRNLSELLDLHSDLDEMFFEHQSALLRLNFPKALELLEVYETALLHHMRDEETYLMPIYIERAADIRGGAGQLFLDEHYKMSEFVRLFKEEIVKLESNPAPEKDLLFLLDRESFYKRLCNHHDKRETDIFYPEIDRITSYEEKLEILGKVACDLRAI